MMNELYLERLTTTTCGLDIGIVEFEAGPGEGLDKVNLSSIQINQTSSINKHLKTIKIQNLVAAIGLFLKTHVVLKSRATAPHHLNTQPSIGFGLPSQNL